MAAGRWIRCAAGALAVAVPADRVAGVERADRVRDGVLPTRAGDWPVIDLAEVLGHAKSTTAGGHVLLSETVAGRIGFRVDRVSAAAGVTWKETPRALAGGPYTGVLIVADGAVPVIDPDRLLTGDRPAQSPRPPRPRTTPAVLGGRVLAFGIVDVAGRSVGFALPAAAVVEVAEAGLVAGVPGAGAAVGVIAWRGAAVPVFDLAAWVGLPGPTDVRRVVIAGVNGERIGLAAGAGVRVLAATQPHMPTRRALTLHDDRVLAAVDFTDVTVIVPDWDRLG